jgi:uncharacterized RDD family membrane protein YckC
MTAIAETKMLREMVTPEGVDLKLRLADAGERASAFFLDTLFMLLGLIGLTLLLVLLGLVIRFRMAEYIAAIWLLGFFLLRNFYFTAFELTLRAATPGKRIVGLRVAMRDGSPLTANAVFARNAMRLIWCAVFVFFPLFNRDRLRVGDLVGGTWVVVAPKRLLDVELSGGPQLAFSEAALDAYGIKELAILEDVLRRKDPVTMAAVASRIRAKIGFTEPMPEEEFLAAYYTGLRRRLEGRLLFGVRRRDKYQRV